jgi:hypothetical protein
VVPKGGQIAPIKIVGESAEWKKAQNKELKNIISLKIKRIQPNFKFSRTAKV